MIDLLAGIGVIINSIQIKKVKQSINRLQEQNILQVLEEMSWLIT